MRVKNLFIIIAIVAVIILIFRYIKQVRDAKNGKRVINNGQIFINWFLAICLVGSLVGIGVTSATGHHQKQISTAKHTKTEKVAAPAKHKKVSEDRITLKFKKDNQLNANGVANVDFTVSPKTTLTIKGHVSGETFAAFNAGTGKNNFVREYSFNIPGHYDIIAKRGKKTLTKKLKITAYTNNGSSSSSAASQTRNATSNNAGVANANTASSSYAGATAAGNSSRQTATQNDAGSARANANSASAAGAQGQQASNSAGTTAQSATGNTAGQLGY